MTANVENMMSVREVPWHGIGTIVTLSDLLNVDDRCRKTLLEAVEEFRRG